MTDLNDIPTLTEEELETLDELLEAEAEKQDSFDFFAMHGLLTALIMGPTEFTPEQVWENAFDEPLGFSKADKQKVNDLIKKLAKEIQGWLDSGQDFPVPTDLTLMDDEGEPPLESWAIGFMTAVMVQEAQWYDFGEEKIAELLFPFMYASGLFADEPEMSDIDEDVELSDQVCGGIPLAIVDLYLTFHGQ
ncbi:MAG: YecA family protein [Oceanobacter sp.]